MGFRLEKSRPPTHLPATIAVRSLRWQASNAPRRRRSSGAPPALVQAATVRAIHAHSEQRSHHAHLQRDDGGAQVSARNLRSRSRCAGKLALRCVVDHHRRQGGEKTADVLLTPDGEAREDASDVQRSRNNVSLCQRPKPTGLPERGSNGHTSGRRAATPKRRA